jgi:hypothetical protein
LLCSHIGLQKLQDPAQQMAAVLQYVQEVGSPGGRLGDCRARPLG